MRLTVYAPVFVRPTETFIYDATRELAANGIDITVIAGQRELSEERQFAPTFVATRPKRWSPARLVRRVLRPVLGRPPGGEAEAMQRAAIRRILIKSRPDVMLANYGTSGALLAPLASELGIPLMVSFHGVDASRLANDPIWQDRYARMFETVAVATGPSEYVRRKLVSLGCPDERAHVLHYGIDTDRIRFSPPASRFDGNEVRFLFVGRLTHKKDPVTLLKSFSHASGELQPLRATLTIVGTGHLLDEVKRTILQLGLSDRVNLIGEQTHEQVIKHFAQAHILVQHSVKAPNGDEEGLPVSITEAMAAGLPVVSTRHSGIPEAVHENVTGYLVDEKDAEGMARYMIKLARDLDLCDQFGTAARKLLEAEFSVPVVQQRLKSLLSIAQNSKA